jgi:hypothetical protein
MNPKKTELNIIFPKHDVTLGEQQFTIRPWGVLKAKDNIKSLGGTIVRITKLNGSTDDNDVYFSILEEAYESITQIIAEDYGLDIEQVHQMPAEWAIDAIKGIMEANKSFLGKLRTLQSVQM